MFTVIGRDGTRRIYDERGQRVFADFPTGEVIDLNASPDYKMVDDVYRRNQEWIENQNRQEKP